MKDNFDCCINVDLLALCRYLIKHWMNLSIVLCMQNYV